VDVIAGGADQVEQGFDRFFAAEYRALVVLLDRVCSGQDEAEDLAQEVMSRACERWAEVERHPNPAAWVRRVALNLAMSGHRRTRRGAAARLRLLARPAEDGPSVDADDDDRLVRAAVASLPVQQRAAVALHYLEDRPVAEIAELLGCAPATARVHLHRGRQALHAALGSMLNEEDER
jgi:RNA polymerase sigma-70 factor (ECF subfamily)